ncbi:MAG: hypothetical protein Tsb0014_05240 [Pleurocapsa sp.]
MPEFNDRDKAIHKYIESWDQGDIDGVIEVLELASYDLELERIIQEINLAYQEEENITPISTDAEIVRNLIQRHLHSAFEEPEKERSILVTPEAKTKTITVGDVARHLQETASLKTYEIELVENLLNSSISLPSSLSIKAIEQLFSKDLHQETNRRFLDKFRNIAIELEMKRSHNNVPLAAARQQKSNYKNKQK